MTPQKYLHLLATRIVERSGLSRATVEALLPHVFDEIRWQMTEGCRCIPIESFGTFAVIDVPERQRHYTYGGRDEIRTLPPKKQLKFAPTRNFKREIDEGCYDGTRKSFSRHPKDPRIRHRSQMRYNHRNRVFLVTLPQKRKYNRRTVDGIPYDEPEESRGSKV